jgi:hypothetical protein
MKHSTMFWMVGVRGVKVLASLIRSSLKGQFRFFYPAPLVVKVTKRFGNR